MFGGQAPSAQASGSGFQGESSSCYIDGDDVRVVVVRVREGRIADWKGGVKDWLVTDESDDDDEEEEKEGMSESGPVGGSRGRSNRETLVNGV